MLDLVVPKCYYSSLHLDIFSIRILEYYSSGYWFRAKLIIYVLPNELLMNRLYSEHCTLYSQPDGKNLLKIILSMIDFH